jgi:hypothetical protein
VRERAGLHSAQEREDLQWQQHAARTSTEAQAERHAQAAVTDLQCSSMRDSEAPDVVRSTGEVSRHRCMHCGGRQQQGGLCQLMARGRSAAACKHYRQPHTPHIKQSPITWSPPWSC